MTSEETGELVELCRLYVREVTLPTPLPIKSEEYAAWREKVAQLPEVTVEAEDAWFDLHDLARTSPEEAWAIIRELVRQAENEDQLHTIGAGVLETFVQNNGIRFTDEIEQEMSGDPRFVTAMRMVNGIERLPGLDERIHHFLGS